MKLTSFRALLACAALVLFSAAHGQTLPTDAVFNRPRVNEQINALVEAQKRGVPVSTVQGVELGRPAPAFRTLKEAAEAGVNPLAEGPIFSLPVSIESDDVPKRKSLVPAVIGGIGLLAVVFVLFVFFLTLRDSSFQKAPAAE